MLFCSIAVLATLTCHPGPVAGNWPQFRGPGATGISEGKGLPVSWSSEKNVVWKVDIPGRGWSSPVVWGDKVFLTTAASGGKEEKPRKGLYFGGNRLVPSPHPHTWEVHCLDFKTGETLWKKVAHEGKPGSALHIKNRAASETPVTDGERVRRGTPKGCPA